MRDFQDYTGFNRGFEQIPKKYEAELRNKIKTVLNISVKNRASFINYKKGKSIVRADKIAQIEAIFYSYDITEIWGI